MARENNASKVVQLRIPAELNASFDQFFSTLKLRILDEAVRRASVRAETDDVCSLQAQDLVAVAQVALRDAASELDEAFLTSELRHVRRAS